MTVCKLYYKNKSHRVKKWILFCITFCWCVSFLLKQNRLQKKVDDGISQHNVGKKIKHSYEFIRKFLMKSAKSGFCVHFIWFYDIKKGCKRYLPLRLRPFIIIMYAKPMLLPCPFNGCHISTIAISITRAALLCQRFFSFETNFSAVLVIEAAIVEMWHAFNLSGCYVFIKYMF